MDHLRPAPSPDLATAYAYPESLTAPYVRVNFVSSTDGAVSVDGRSGGLGDGADKAVFSVLRKLADVILVGGGTARAEKYRGARSNRIGGDAPPPIAVVTGSADLDPGSGMFTDTRVPTIVLTLDSAPPQRRAALAGAGAEVVALPRLDPPDLLGALAARGLHRVLCEGGPSLFGALIAADAVDELCLTLAPLVIGGDAGRISSGGSAPSPERLELVHVLHEDGTLLLRYRRLIRSGD